MPSQNYEQGWNAINELIRSDGTWSGFERNVFYANNRVGTFSDVSAIVGLDCIEDSRSFVLGDFEHDGRVEVILKNRNGPQLRVLKNVMAELSPAIAFRLTGKKSNRDAIGAAVTVETPSGKQTRWLQAGSGFLAQHSKELLFGLGEAQGPVSASIRWPSGLVQNLHDLPINHRIWVEEGSPPTRMEPFQAAAAPRSGSPSESFSSTNRALPDSVESWLLVPVAAPDFSLSDLAERAQKLSSGHGKPQVVYFWSAASPSSETDLAALDRSYPRWLQAGLRLFAVNADDSAGPSADASSLAPYRRLSFPVFPYSPDVVAIYNILFRSLFDRHRDMPLPTVFLLDETGAIVKIYQGPISVERIDEDFRHIPQTATERLAKALPFPGVSEITEFSRNYLSLGSVFFDRGYMEPAESFFRQALRDDPSSAEALYGLGSVYLQQQKAAEARASFEQALKLQPGYPATVPNAWNNLGILAAREGHTNEAVRNFQRALQMDPDHVIALQNLGNAYRQDKDWENAKSTLQRAIELSPENAEANYSLGMVFAQLGDTEHAYEYLQHALAARPEYPEALNNLGILYIRTQRPDQAENSFRESIRVAPEFDQAYLNLARLYAIEHEPQNARAVLLDLLKQHPGHPQAEKELEQLPQ
jgi:Flp pilus assembly protein TadD/peroxiredoxin